MGSHSNDNMNLHPSWAKGNVVVICDGPVWFRVNDFHLYAASPSTKFAAAIAPDTSPSTAQSPKKLATLHDPDLTLHFTGENAVSSPVFLLFLEVATTYKLPSTPQAEEKLLLGPLLTFLKRWQCDALHALVSWQILSQIRNNEMFPLQAFNIGAFTNNLEICKTALREVGWPHDWDTLDPWYDAGAVNYPWNTRGWSLRLYREHTIPPDFLFALAKAKDLRTGDLAERFAICLARAQETGAGKNAVIEK